MGGGGLFSRLLEAKVWASAAIMLDTPCYEVVRRVLATHFIRQFPFQFPSLRKSVPSRITWSLQHYWQHEYSILPVPQIWRPLHNWRQPPLPNGGTDPAASGMHGNFGAPRQPTARFHHLIRPCREQWHLHKHTRNVALSSQNWGTHKCSLLDIVWSPTNSMETMFLPTVL